jgi:uncharacterized protein YacL
MEICILAKIVLVLAIVSLVFHLCIFGLTVGFLVDALFMGLFVFIANRYCDSWIAKAIVIYAIISTLVYAFMCSKRRKMYRKIDKTKRPTETTPNQTTPKK